MSASSNFTTRALKVLRRSLGGLPLLLALFADYTCFYILFHVFNIDLVYFLVMVLILSFMAGVLVMDIERSIFYVCFSVFLGAIITIVLLLAPLIANGEMLMVSYLLPLTISNVVVSLVFSIFISLVGAAFGSLVGENFS